MRNSSLYKLLYNGTRNCDHGSATRASLLDVASIMADLAFVLSVSDEKGSGSRNFLLVGSKYFVRIKLFSLCSTYNNVACEQAPKWGIEPTSLQSFSLEDWEDSHGLPPPLPIFKANALGTRLV